MVPLCLIREVVENITEAADELLSKGRENLDHMEFGELLAYAESLCIIQDALAGRDLAEIGLDFDIDERYLLQQSSPTMRDQIEMNMEDRINGILLELEIILTRKYPVKFINHQQCFIQPSGQVFSVQRFPGSEAIVVEYAESEADAVLYRFDDGDRFYLDEMEDQQLIQAVLREIKG